MMALGGFVTAADRRFRKPRSTADDHESTQSASETRTQKRDPLEDPGIGDASPAHGGGSD
jgi:hypothetical protein